MHDGPLKKPDGSPEDLGSMFSNIIARSGPSADNSQATSFFMINDEGVWLIGRPRGKEALKSLASRPRSWLEWSDRDWRHGAVVHLVAVTRGSRRRLGTC